MSEIRTTVEPDYNRTFHWAESVRQGRNVITTEAKRRKVKSKAKRTIFNGKITGWASSYSPELVVKCCDEHLIKGRYQKDVCEDFGIAKATLQRWIEAGGLYDRAKEELKK